MKIKQKLTLGFLSVAMLVAIVGFFSVRISQKILQEKIGQSSAILAAEVLKDIDRHICTRIETFQEYCRDLIAQRTISESNKEFEKLDDIQAYIDKHDRQWISEPKEKVTAFMQDLINNELSEELRKKIDFYREKYGHKVFNEVFMTNRYGANVAQTQKTTDYYQADEKWWQEAKKNGLYVSNIGYDESADIYSTDICIRIDDEAGNFLGVAKVVLNIKDSINHLTKEEKEEVTIEFKLLTKDKKIIYATEEYEFLEDLSEQVHSYFLQGQHNHQLYSIVGGDKPGEDEELIAHAHSKGYKDYKGLGWILLVEYETKEIFAPIARLKNWILIVSLVITVLAIIFGFFISRSISVPIGKLTAAAVKIGKGSLDTQVKINSNDETAQLAKSFNKMADDLKNTTTSINTLNAANQQLQASQQQLKASNQQLQFEIAERKEAEDALRESEEKVRTLYDSSSDAIMLLDEKGFFDCNDATLRLFGCASREEFCSSHPVNFSPPTQPCGTDSLTLSNQRIATAMQTGHNRFEWMHKRIDSDEAFPADVLLNAMELGGKKVLQARVYDITERKRAEKTLQESEERFRQVVENTQELIWEVDANGLYIYASPVTEKVFGYKPEEIIGKKHFYDLFHPEDRKELKKQAFAVFAKKQAFRGFINHNVHKNGQTIWLSTSGIPVLDERENLLGYRGVDADITERKQAEGELERLNKQLESTIEELSIANRELKDFAHITAHDLKAPLRGIGTLAEWLATDYADKFDEEGKKQVGLLVQRSQEMYDQITGILHFSEIGRETQEKEEIDLNRLIEKIITSVNPPENIQITIADKLPTLVCAQVPLTQIFQNLLSNAIYYADKADGQVTIGCVEENGLWKFSVADNGPGIEEKYFDKIFQIFQTLPVKGEHRGTGIGLAIVRKAVEMYGGKIWLKSAPGQGTTFFFTFPKQEMKVACDEKLEANIVG